MLTTMTTIRATVTSIVVKTPAALTVTIPACTTTRAAFPETVWATLTPLPRITAAPTQPPPITLSVGAVVIGIITPVPSQVAEPGGGKFTPHSLTTVLPTGSSQVVC